MQSAINTQLFNYMKRGKLLYEYEKYKRWTNIPN